MYKAALTFLPFIRLIYSSLKQNNCHFVVAFLKSEPHFKKIKLGFMFAVG